MADFFANPGAWLEQAGKDLAQGGQDFGETLQDGAQVVGEALPGVAQVVGDAAQVVGEALQDGAQVIGDVVTNVGEAFTDVPVNPDPNWVVDQIENNINQQPTPDQVVDQIESIPGFDTVDLQRGGDADDYANGGMGDDILFGVFGGVGPDTFLLTDGLDYIIDFNPSEGDKISLQNFSGVVVLDKVMNTDDVQIVFGDNVTTVQGADANFLFHSFVGSEDNTITAWNFDPVQWDLFAQK